VRYNVYIQFPKWSGAMAAAATVKKIDRDGLSWSPAARELLPILFQQLSTLPDWGSARDVYRNVIPALYSKRASRLGGEARRQRLLEEAGVGPLTVVQPLGINANQRSRATRKGATPISTPYEEADVREAFASLISSRSQGILNVKTIQPGPQTDVQVVNAAPAFNSLVQLTSLKGILLVVNFFADWHQPSVHFRVKYKCLSDAFPQVRFVMVDHTDGQNILQQEQVDSFPTIKIYMRGQPVCTIQNSDDKLLSSRIAHFVQLLEESRGGAPSFPQRDSWSPPTIVEEPERLHISEQRVKLQNQVESLVRREDDTEHDAEGLDEQSFWAALEEACGELKYTVDQMAAFLATKDFPEELLGLIKIKTGCTDINKVREMLLPQVPNVLQKVVAAKAEIARKKTAEESRCLQKAKLLGRCPANFEWIKMPDGYRCAGGSHWVSEADVNTIEIN
jgi:thiol-disulfide isomerase/thioredoxin